jgi:subtilisin-like proprotein convertase family protein
MISYRYGGRRGRRHTLSISDEFIAVRTRDRTPVTSDVPYEVAPLSQEARDLINEFEVVTRFRDAGVDVLRARAVRGVRALRDKTRQVLKKESAVRFAGRVLTEPQSNTPVLYTENLFVKFDDDETRTACRKTLSKHGLHSKRELNYARNGFFVAAMEGTGLKVFDLAAALLEEPGVELCHPELIRRVRERAAFAPQWHLKRTQVNGQTIDEHANVQAAWELSEGAGIIIAVIDDGMDLDHEEFRSSGKIVTPRDVTRQTNNPRPGSGDNHGTACAGVACADGAFGASGVAPRAQLMPIRLASGLGSQAEADAFIWAAQHGADVISCSWGPMDGRWWDPSDPVHNQVVPLPDSTRLAIDWAIANGRNGKGCVITWAAGNGNESVDNDGYAGYEKVIAVAACNDEGMRSAYSDFGRANWCAFPSNHGLPSRTPGIWTTDRSGVGGYNPGQTTQGDAAGHYTNSFGGTSSSTPGVAGVAALILARNPDLHWDEVKNIMKHSCDQIDPANGKYDAEGHSAWYGYGRVNARRAAELAAPAQPERIVTFSAIQDVRIRDLRTSKLSVPVAETASLKSLKITVDIEHTYIGDLVVSIKPPATMGVSQVILHNREGRGTDNIKKTYDAVSTPALLNLNGKKPQGTWVLVVQDKERLDTGRIRSVLLEMAV